MAQTFVRASRPVGEVQQLRLEKVGVIAGFLIGLPLAVSEVAGALSQAGAPEWLQVSAVIACVAATTRLGLMAAAGLARKLNAR